MKYNHVSDHLALQSETDSSSIGHIVCTKAEELSAAAVVMGTHAKGPVRGCWGPA